VPFGTLSPESRIPVYAKEVGISHAVLCAVCGTSPDRLGQAVRGMKALSNHEGLVLVETLLRLIDLTEAIKPLALPKDVAGIRVVLDAFDSVDANVIRERMNKVLEGNSSTS
jgi:hypothetical protein